jgi:colanic acid/amylovoran biosynthesis glycosyltransferase
VQTIVNGMSATDAIALQRCDGFVDRTVNWLYDHLRFIPRYTPLVLCNRRLNRIEFPELEDWCPRLNLTRRIWHRVTRSLWYPTETRWLKQLTPRLLHSHFGNVAMQDHGLQRALDVPWLVSFYGADAYQGHQAELQRKYSRLFEQATRILALGPAMKARLERLDCPPEKIVIHPLGVDVDNLPNCARVFKSGETLRILFAGTFREKKGVQYVVEAVSLARLAGLRIELHLAGDEGGKPGDRETKKEVFRRISRFGIEDIVIHHSFLRFQELLALALRSHVFVAPSVTAANGDSEGTPFVIQQMMATGMPVITTVHSDIPYLFGEHQQLLVPERDAGAIAERFQRYVDDPDSLIADGAALRRRIRAFDVRECAANLGALYDAIR